MMKCPGRIILSVAMLVYNLTCIYAQGALSVSATGHVFAEVVPVYSASETAQMNFGKFSPGPLGGEIILTPDGAVSVLGSVFTGTGTHTAASFYVTGDNDASYTITLPPGPVVLTNTLNSRTIKVVDWVSAPSSVPAAGQLRDGFQVVQVGATLKVGNLYDNPVGIYTGTYTITFDFN
jgi:hypothetical protein